MHMSYTRVAVVARTVTVDGVAFDLYPAPRGAGFWTPADPVLAIASVPDEDHLDFLRRNGLTNVLHGYEGVYDPMRPEHRRYVALLSPNAVACVLCNAAVPIDPATVAAVDAALRAE